MRDTLIHFAALRAANRFGNNDGTFNLAGFSASFAAIAGIKERPGGRLCRAMLNGQPGIDILRGGSHYRIHVTHSGGDNDES